MINKRGLDRIFSNKTRFFRRLAVYIGSATAAIVALAKFQDRIRSSLDVSPRVAILIACSVLVIPLGFDALPAWLDSRRRKWVAKSGKTRPRANYFRLDPYGEADKDDFKRADGAHERVLRWINSARETALYLTSRSGVGKSSLLQAYVIP
ncbi:MAG TPA: hypothetical protein VN345_20755, partial [Blastocatellia bacterium]|nr:hypothetical protein [Blastocatellia bacterium]